MCSAGAAQPLRFVIPLGGTTFFMWLQNQSYRIIIEKTVGAEFLGMIGLGIGLVQEHNHIGISLDIAALAQIRKLRTAGSALFHIAVELGSGQNRNGQFFG